VHNAIVWFKDINIFFYRKKKKLILKIKNQNIYCKIFQQIIIQIIMKIMKFIIIKIFNLIKIVK